MDVEKQVVAIWAATNGYTDDIPVEEVKAFEKGLREFVEKSHPGLLAAIKEKKTLTDEIKADLKQFVLDFKASRGKGGQVSTVPDTAPAISAGAPATA